MKPFFIVAFLFACLALSGCHKLGKKRCNDCPKWTNMETMKNRCNSL